LQIRISHLSKSFGPLTALDDVSFEVTEGSVTGFIGPNGAGKTTTLRILLSLDNPTKGEATFDGLRYSDLRNPIMQVGAALDVDAIHPGQTALAFLRTIGIPYGISRARAAAILEEVGLISVARKRVSEFSLGMRQRLNIAASMLGDPSVYIFDEPQNGLDIDGISWFRQLVHVLAERGKTVLVSSHQMSELEMMANHIVILGSGRVLANQTLESLKTKATLARALDANAFEALLKSSMATFTRNGEAFTISDRSPRDIGQLAASGQLALSHLEESSSSLEASYRQLVADAVQYRSEIPQS